MHIKVQISLAQFEFLALDNSTIEQRLSNARQEFQKINDWAPDQFLKQERLLLLEYCDCVLMYRHRHQQFT
jgi:hypothetical protein